MLKCIRKDVGTGHANAASAQRKENACIYETEHLIPDVFQNIPIIDAMPIERQFLGMELLLSLTCFCCLLQWCKHLLRIHWNRGGEK